MITDYVRPDWYAPLDVQARIDAVPPGATVKGMFFTNPVALAAKRGYRWPKGQRFVAFKDYPLTEHIHVLVEAAQACTPELPLREGLRRLGQSAFSVFAESMVGITVLGIAGRSWESALKLVTRAYRTTGPLGVAELGKLCDEYAVVSLRNVWNFADSYHVGVFEGAMRHYGKSGEVLCRVEDVGNVDLRMATTG